MKTKVIIFLAIMAASWLMMNCENKTGAIANQSSIASSKSSSGDSKASCDMINKVLNGVFKNNYQEGTMTWLGGAEGRIEIAGLDYNDVTCTYVIPDCGDEVIKMICNQAAYNTTIKIFSPDSIKLGDTVYSRVQ